MADQAPRAIGWARARSLGLLVFTGLLGLLGGASQAAPLRLAALELAAVALLAVSACDPVRSGLRERPAPLWIVGAIVALPLLQLVPLPPAVWRALPGRDLLQQASTLAEATDRWRPLSLDPSATLGAALALLPPVAMFVAAGAADVAERLRLTWVWLASAGLGLALGLAQLSEPNGGPAYFDGWANFGSLVGVFANRNHEAALLAALIPLAAALAATGLDGEPPARNRPPGAGRQARMAGWIAALFVPLALVALAVVRSRAGVILAPLALIGASGALSARTKPSRVPALVLGVSVLAAIGAVALFAFTPLLDRFTGETGAWARLDIWRQTLAAAAPFEPAGAGVGSFERIYRAAEPVAIVGPAYVNHAHDEYLEIWLEAGWAGVALVVAFVAWFLVRTWRVWRGGARPVGRAASASIAILLAHSIVDYPLRTETLAGLFAFACACLAAPERRRRPLASGPR